MNHLMPIKPFGTEFLLEKNLVLGVPNKIKHFIWRACCESLPTKRNLFSRKVTWCATCDRCKEEIEDVIHALWGYQALKEVWWEEPSFRN